MKPRKVPGVIPKVVGASQRGHPLVWGPGVAVLDEQGEEGRIKRIQRTHRQARAVVQILVATTVGGEKCSITSEWPQLWAD